jgi:hypothetical protein
MRGLLTLSLAALCLSAPPARAVWADRADLIYRSAHTLDEGEFEFGVFSPLQYGVSDQVQIALHPILLLVLTPHASLRWRVLPEGPLTLALDVDVTWSFLDEVDPWERQVVDSSACRDCGFPGTLQLTGTASWEFAPGFTWSFGAGAGMDVLDLDPQRGMLELHTSLLWLIDSENLLMAHGNINVHPWHHEPTSREYFQLMYAHSLGALHLGIGVVVGDFLFVEDGSTVRSLPGGSGAQVVYEGRSHRLPVYPVLDVWIRL